MRLVDRLNIFWLMAAAQTVFTLGCVFTGRVRVRGHTYADRPTGPKWFWFAIALFAFSVAIVVYEALNPPY